MRWTVLEKFQHFRGTRNTSSLLESVRCQIHWATSWLTHATSSASPIINSAMLASLNKYYHKNFTVSQLWKIDMPSLFLYFYRKTFFSYIVFMKHQPFTHWAQWKLSKEIIFPHFSNTILYKIVCHDNWAIRYWNTFLNTSSSALHLL